MNERESRISCALKESIDKHESRLQMMSQNLAHAHTHLQALTSLAERLRIHLDVKKTQAQKDKLPHITECGKQDVKTNKATKDENAYFQFPSVGDSLDSEFLKMVESLVEGIMLVSDETNIGKLARDLKGPLIHEDLLKWRYTVTVLQKYDDQVRRAIEYFERQQED